MTFAMRERFGIQQQRGFWLRCFLGIVLAAVISELPHCARAQVNCAQNRTQKSGWVTSQIVDPFGAPVESAVILRTAKSGRNVVAKTDAGGTLSLDTPAGGPKNIASLRGVESARVELSVGHSLLKIGYKRKLSSSPDGRAHRALG